MDYYSSLNSMSQQSSALDYAGSQLLEQGTQGYTAQMEGFQNDFSKQIGDINAEYQGKVAEITGAFARKDTAQEQLVSALEGAGGALEITKSAKAGYEKYKGKIDETTNKIKDAVSGEEPKASGATPKTDEIMAGAGDEGELTTSRLGGELTTPRLGTEIELQPMSGGTTQPSLGGEPRRTYRNPFGELNPERPDLPEVPTREPSELPEVPTPTEPPIETGVGAEEGLVGGADTALEGGSAVALEETAGEIAVAGAFDPVVDVVAGGLMLAGVGVGMYDLFTKKKTEKKIKKKQEKAEKASQEEQDQAQAQYDQQVKATSKSYDTIRNNITANTHAGVAIGVQNMRNTYKSGGTF